MTNAAPIWYNKGLGGWGGSRPRTFCLVSPLFYYTTKKFLFQVLTKGFCENFIKKFLLICLTSPGVSWYNKRGRRNLFFFFFFAAPEIRSSSSFKTRTNDRGREANKCSTNRCSSTFLVDTRTIVRFQVPNSTHHYYILKTKKSQYFCINFFIFFCVFF